MSDRFRMFFCAPDTEQAEYLEGNFISDDWRERMQRDIKEDIQHRIHVGDERMKDLEVQGEIKKIGNKASKLL
jgi:hypothetical protein